MRGSSLGGSHIRVVFFSALRLEADFPFGFASSVIREFRLDLVSTARRTATIREHATAHARRRVRKKYVKFMRRTLTFV